MKPTSFSEEELKLRDRTLSRTASDKDEDRKSLDPVMAPFRGGMISAGSEGIRKIEPPSGPDIDRETLEHRERALRATPPDSDPKRVSVGQITSPERGGMR